MTAYREIKDIVIGTTQSLDMVPSNVVRQLWGGSVPGINTRYLQGIKHPRISCITHAYMPYSYERSHSDHYDEMMEYTQHCVCTVAVDNVPALFFIQVWEVGTRISHTYTYTLDTCACSLFLHLITGKTAWAYTNPVTEDEEVEELTEDNGIEIVYGST